MIIENYIAEKSTKKAIISAFILSLTIPIIFTISPYLVLPLVVVICIRIVSSYSDAEAMAYVFYYVAFANVLKFNRSMASLGLLFQFAFIVRKIIKNKGGIPAAPLFSGIVILLYSIFSYLFTSYYNITYIMKMFLWLYSFYFIVNTNREANEKACIIAFALGQLVSAIIGLFLDYYPQMRIFLNEQYVYGVSSSGSGYIVDSRFCGLFPDSNLFGMEILLAIALLVYLNSRGKINSLYFSILSLGLGLLGLYSLSKMYILGLILILLVFVFSANNGRSKFVAVLGLLLSSIVLIFNTRIQSLLQTYSYRFSSAKSLSELTTHRSSNILEAIEHFTHSADGLIGTGLGNSFFQGHGIHNVYLESINMYGIIGVLLLIVCVVALYKTGTYKRFKPKSFLSFFPLIILMYCGMGLDALNYDYFIFSVILSVYINTELFANNNQNYT